MELCQSQPEAFAVERMPLSAHGEHIRFMTSSYIIWYSTFLNNTLSKVQYIDTRLLFTSESQNKNYIITHRFIFGSEKWPFWLFSQSIKIGISEKWPSQFPRGPGTVLRCFDLPNQRSKTMNYSVYIAIKQNKTASPHIGEAETRDCHFEMTNDQLINYLFSPCWRSKATYNGCYNHEDAPKIVPIHQRHQVNELLQETRIDGNNNR